MLDDGVSDEVRENYLNDHGIVGEESAYTYTIERDDEGVGQQNYDKDELDIVCRLWHDCPDGLYYAEVVWEYAWDGIEEGKKPHDRVGIGYERQWWDYSSYDVSETTETSYLVEPEPDEFGDGAVFKMNDYEANKNRQYWCGLYLDPVGDYSSDERRVQAGYAHTWGQTVIENVSVGFPAGISITASNEDKYWETKTEIGGSYLLRVAQKDSVYCS